MTEKKRFGASVDESCIVDNLDNKGLYSVVDTVECLNHLHEENQSYKQNVSKTLQKHYNRLVELSNNDGEDECGFMAFIKFLSQELDVGLEDLE